MRASLQKARPQSERCEQCYHEQSVLQWPVRQDRGFSTAEVHGCASPHKAPLRCKLSCRSGRLVSWTAASARIFLLAVELLAVREPLRRPSCLEALLLLSRYSNRQSRLRSLNLGLGPTAADRRETFRGASQPGEDGSTAERRDRGLRRRGLRRRAARRDARPHHAVLPRRVREQQRGRLEHDPRRGCLHPVRRDGGRHHRRGHACGCDHLHAGPERQRVPRDADVSVYHHADHAAGLPADANADYPGTFDFDHFGPFRCACPAASRSAAVIATIFMF